MNQPLPTGVEAVSLENSSIHRGHEIYQSDARVYQDL